MIRYLVPCFLVALGCQRPVSKTEPAAEPSGASATQPRAPAVAEAKEASPAPAPSSSSPQKFGDAIVPGRTAQLTEVLSDPKAYADAPVIVEGLVRRACKAKGCWMELASDADEAQRCRVTFKDYGFFVPTDSAGAHARIQGNVTTQLVTAGRVEHLEREGAVFPNKHSDGSALEVRFVATGVELVR